MALLTDAERKALRDYECGILRIQFCFAAKNVLQESGLYDLCGDDQSCEEVARFLLVNDDKARAALAAERARVVDALRADVEDLKRRGLTQAAMTLEVCLDTLPPIGGWKTDTAAARGTGEE